MSYLANGSFGANDLSFVICGRKIKVAGNSVSTKKLKFRLGRDLEL